MWLFLKTNRNLGTALEDAVMIAGIDQPGQRGNSGQTTVVSDRHHYPSPFSQVRLFTVTSQ